MIAILIIIIIGIESVLRYCSLCFCPIDIRLAYALFIMSPKKAEENIILNQRVTRGGFGSEKELFEHYAAISGKPYDEISKKFSRERDWRRYFGRRYFSGHGAFEQIQKMHLGLMSKPGQKLQTMEIDENSRRKTGCENINGKTCLFIGASVLFGLGATSDEHTICGKIGRSKNMRTINYGFFGFNSLQELISLQQSDARPDYVISLSGWNEVDQRLWSNSKVSSLSQSCDFRANDSAVRKALTNFFNRFVIVKAIKRFIAAFLTYEQISEDKRDYNTVNIYPMF